MEKNVKREIVRRSFEIVSTLAFLIILTCVWYGPNSSRVEAEQKAVNNSARLAFQDLSEGISLENALPVSDLEGSSVEPYEFAITNYGMTTRGYEIVFENVADDTGCEVLANQYLRYTIQKDEEAYTDAVNLTEDGTLLSDVLLPNEKHSYRLKFWIDEAADNEAMGKCFQAQVSVKSR